MQILVVDDEPDVRTLFVQRFRKEIRAKELKLVFAYSGEEALDYLSDGNRADVVLVLSDINMPGMTGLELLKRIKNQPPPLPVCMMTAYGSEAYQRAAEDHGCEGYLTKPIDFNALKQRIRSLAASE